MKVVLNNFQDDEKHLKLLVSVFQNMFPAINVKTMKLTEARRVVLFHRDPETDKIEVRHYSIDVKSIGVSKSVKTIIQADVPDLHSFQEIGDYILRGAYASESDVEDGPESSVTLPQKYVGRGNRKAERRAIKLTELGPLSKTREEAKELQERATAREKLKQKRKEEQEENVRRKRARDETEYESEEESGHGDDDDSYDGQEELIEDDGDSDLADDDDSSGNELEEDEAENSEGDDDREEDNQSEEEVDD
ncbi:hypothetical protein HDU96_001938 [Phlyctochytrium bullatum]|nr:hypothetical protein HDU96_001938 [Phlyctochytrium bullatum]